jgi:hypothetical protein
MLLFANGRKKQHVLSDNTRRVNKRFRVSPSRATRSPSHVPFSECYKGKGRRRRMGAGVDGRAFEVSSVPMTIQESNVEKKSLHQ